MAFVFDKVKGVCERSCIVAIDINNTKISPILWKLFRIFADIVNF